MIKIDQPIYQGRKAFKIEGEMITFTEDIIANEFPLTFMLNGKEFATIVCTPQNIREMAIGFLASEGVIRGMDDIKHIHVDSARGFAHIELTKPLPPSEVDHSKRFIGSCCGKSRQFYFKSDVQTARTITHSLTITVKQCLHLMNLLQENSRHFKKTGGVHNAALCTIDKLLEIRTDIGRHNALDKIYGYIIEQRQSVKDKVIVFSGRISSEVLLKISKMGIGIIISTSAPTNLALELADDLGITTIGFTRGNKMNVYTHADRVKETNSVMKSE
ncbi:formate dehydrogenase accessory sulfurtransferase FdhD [Pseudogracilibacillus sp. SE30717A]|uniref:formate dehydrogenase accessory sulfurtransferase FdhD n=1 Tax=Pseudogracilibacillus sp. SE30717A TaxID=3098293 RepID=UPI003FA722AB